MVLLTIHYRDVNLCNVLMYNMDVVMSLKRHVMCIYPENTVDFFVR